jgi:hypothetical protein
VVGTPLFRPPGGWVGVGGGSLSGATGRTVKPDLTGRTGVVSQSAAGQTGCLRRATTGSPWHGPVRQGFLPKFRMMKV